MAEKKRGRKSKYSTEVEPYLDKIREWASDGATEKEICGVLQISTSTFYEYKNKYSELSRALKKGRKELVLEIRGALKKKALGFTYEESKQYISEDQDGKKKIHTEKYKKYSPPSEAAGNMLLKNYDETWISTSPELLKLREQELELKKLQMENNEW